jgi:hypothetical protein
MQIHELTQQKTTELDEGLADIAGKVGGAVGKRVSAVKDAGSAIANPFRQASSAYKQAGVNQQAAGVAGKAQLAWNNYVENLKSTQGVTPQILQTNLRAFVQKNLLGNMAYQYDNLINKDAIENNIQALVNNTNPGQDAALWTNLVKTVGVAQVGSGTGIAPKGRNPKPGGGGLAPATNPGDIATAIQNSGVSPGVYKNMAAVLQNVAGTNRVSTTNNPGLDAFLKSLGFTVQ